MGWTYDSGGHHKDQGKYEKSYKKIFKGVVWPCPECNQKRTQGHDEECSKHWRNK